jgi:hypothetical protein
MKEVISLIIGAYHSPQVQYGFEVYALFIIKTILLQLNDDIFVLLFTEGCMNDGKYFLIDLRCA